LEEVVSVSSLGVPVASVSCQWDWKKAVVVSISDKRLIEEGRNGKEEMATIYCRRNFKIKDINLEPFRS
jgi:hypothetical protein